MIYEKFISHLCGNENKNKNLLFDLIKKDGRAKHSAYYMNTHNYEQYFIIIECNALLQAEKHIDGTVKIVIDYPLYGYFDYDCDKELFEKYLKPF